MTDKTESLSELDRTWGEQIAPKARREHPHDFYDVDDEELADIIDGTLLNPDESKELPNGRTAYWNDEEGIVVITDPHNPDGGTAFKPDDGKKYFDRLKSSPKSVQNGKS